MVMDFGQDKGFVDAMFGTEVDWIKILWEAAICNL
jgi:hypothetical protein